MTAAARAAGKRDELVESVESRAATAPEFTGADQCGVPELFEPRLRLVVTASIAVYSSVAGVVASAVQEPRRSAVVAAAYLPMAVAGTVVAAAAASRSRDLLSRIWRLYRAALSFAVVGAIVYAVGFGVGSKELTLLGVPVVVGGIAILARIYALAVRLFRGSSENLLELVDFATVAFSTLAVLAYGVGEPLIRQGRYGQLHMAILPAFSAVFIFAILYIVTAPTDRPKAPEYVFLAAGFLLFSGTIAEATMLVAGEPDGKSRPLIAFASVALLCGLGLLSAVPLYAVRQLGGSEKEFRGPWQPPRFLLPYWSLLALVVLAAAVVIDGRRLSAAYGFVSFAGATALVVVRQLLTIKENYRLFRDLSAAEESRTMLLRELLKGVEEERVKIANSIDAGPVQQLTALMLRAERASSRETPHPQLLIHALMKQLGGAITELRELTRTLRPRIARAEGLAEAIAIEAKEALTPGSVALDIDVEDVPGLTPDQQLHLFRIAEEAIDNVRMHSGASKVSVSFRSEPGLDPSTSIVVLEIKDDGRGFIERRIQREAGKSLPRTGISSMRERADMLGADFEIISTPGAGTVVRVVMEIRRHTEKEQRAGSEER